MINVFYKTALFIYIANKYYVHIFYMYKWKTIKYKLY